MGKAFDVLGNYVVAGWIVVMAAVLSLGISNDLYRFIALMGWVVIAGFVFSIWRKES